MDGEKFLSLLMEVKEKIAELKESVSRLREDVEEMKKEMVRIFKLEGKQKKMENGFGDLLKCCDKVNEMASEFAILREKVKNIELNRRTVSDRIWGVGLGIVERLIYIAIIVFLIAVFKFKAFLFQ